MFHVKLRHLVGVLICGGVLAGAKASRAHGGEPLPRRVYDVDGQWLLVTNFGVIAQDSPARYVCEEAFLGGDGFLIAPISRREWMTYSSSAVMRTSDGCSFERVAQLPKLPSAVDLAPDRATIAHVINEEDVPALWWTRDLGASFEQLDLTSVGEVHWTGLGFGEDDTVYLSGYSKDEEDRGSAVIVSVGLEERLIERHEGLDGAKFPYIFEVGGERLAGIASVDEQLVLFWGALDELSQNQRALNSWPTGMWSDAEGGELYVASAEPLGGVLHGVLARGGEVTWTELVPEHSAKCVGLVGEQLHLCARRDREMHDLSVVQMQDETITPAVSFEGLEGPSSECGDGSDVARTCGVVWPELARALRIELPDEVEEMSDGSGDVDMGEVEGARADMAREEMSAVMMEPGAEPDSTESCACDVSGRASEVGWGGLLWFGLLFGIRRRSRAL